MKKKLLLLCSAGLMSLSLVSCGEKKIENDKAEEQIEDAVQDSINKIEEVSKKDHLYVTADLNSNLSVTMMGETSTNKVTMEAQGNLDLKAMRAETPSLGETEFYLRRATEETGVRHIAGMDDELGHYVNYTGEKKYSYEDVVALNDGIAKEYSKYVEKETYENASFNREDIFEDGDQFELDEYTSSMTAATIISYVDVLSNLNGFKDLAGQEDEYNLVITVKENVEKFLDGEMTAEDFLSYLESLDDIDVDYDEEDRPVIIDLLNLIKDNNPEDYLIYTTSKKSGNLTIKSTFDYANWSKGIKTGLNKIISDYPESTLAQYELSESLMVLPESLDLECEITIHKDGYISAVNALVKAVGPTIEGVQLYNINFDAAAHLNISDKKVDVKTLTIPEYLLSE